MLLSYKRSLNLNNKRKHVLLYQNFKNYLVTRKKNFKTSYC